jgi:uncharacterized protein (TIGR02099 family)
MRHTSKLKTFAWYGVVGVVVAFAVLVSVVRLTIGSVSEYRQHLEAMAGNFLGKPVAIAHMDARLIGFKPTVVLDEISLLDEESHEPLAHFRSVMIALNPLSSLRHLRPIIDLSVHGAKIVIGLREDGTLQIQGVVLAKDAASRSSSGDLGAWLVGQSRLALKESTLVWRDLATGDEAVFAGVNLELQNLPNRHRLSGYVQLPKELGKELRLALDIRGDLLRQKDWEGDLYLKAVAVRPAPWLQQFDYKGLQLKKGSVDLDLWSHWRGGLLQGIEGKFDLAELVFSGTEEAQLLKGVAGQVRYLSDDDGWRLQLAELQLQTGKAPVETLAIELERNAEGSRFQASALPLGLLHHYAPYLPQLLKAQREWLVQAKPDGRVTAVRVELAEEGALRASAGIEDLHLSPWRRYPGVSGLSGQFAMDGDIAELVVDSGGLELAMPRLFRKPLAMEQARGVVQLRREGEQWRVSAEPLQLSNRDISAEVSFDSWIAPGEAPLIALSAQVSDGRATAVPAYLPVHIMSEGSVAWLDKAFVDGRIAAGRVLLHGRLDGFPFRQQQGRFEVLLDAEDVTLHYQDRWPDLARVKGEVHFDGPGMAIDAQRATVYSSRLGATRVGIADFRLPVLQVTGSTDAPMSDALRFLQDSPLAQHTGGALERLRTEGTAKIALSLAIPLSKRIVETHPLKVLGRVSFQGGSIQVVDGVTFSAVTGDLQFSETSFEAQALQARLYDAPARLSVYTEERRGNTGNVVIAGQGRASAQALQREVDLPILGRLEGDTDWQARLTIPRGGSGGSELVVHSTLEGMALDLPLPGAKPREGARPLTATVGLGGGKTQRRGFSYGELVSVAWLQESEPFRLLGAATEFGSQLQPAEVKPGVMRIGGSVDDFQLNDWLALRHEFDLPGEGGSPLPLELAMQRLHLIPSVIEPGGAEWRAGEIPPYDISVEDFAYEAITLGKVVLRGRSEGKRLLVDVLRVNAPNFSVVTDGQWTEGGGSRFAVKLSSDNFGSMMRDLGFVSVISGGKANAEGRLTWPGSPAAFDMGKLGGELHVRIDEGTMEDVDPGAGKLLGLLSLQALPKRLFLDFSDISKKGLQFSRLEGDFRFADGNALTQNLHLESSPANMLVTGRTGLVARDFEQLIAVVPNVSGTVSVAGALAWGPQAAAVLLVLQKLFQSDIDAATMTRYELTGSWSAPKLTKLDPLESSTTGGGQ